MLSADRNSIVMFTTMVSRTQSQNTTQDISLFRLAKTVFTKGNKSFKIVKKDSNISAVKRDVYLFPPLLAIIFFLFSFF